MILQTLTLKYYKQYEDLVLDFKEGLTGIVGRNGAGKSTVFEGVLVCLFGDIRGDKKLIRSSWAEEKKAVSLELIFEVQNRTYKIVRAYKGKALTHHAHLYDHKDLAIATGATPVTKEVEKLIGMDKEAFTRSIFSGQKELGEISNTKGEERRKMVRKMVGLDKLDKIQNIVREDRNSAKNQIKGKIGLLLEKEDLEAKEKDLKAKIKERDKEQKQLDKLDKQLKEKQKKYELARTEFEAQNKLYKTYNELTTELTRFETGVENLLNRDKEHDTRITALKTLEKELKKQAPQIAAFEKQQKELTLLDKQKDDFESSKRLKQQQQLVAQQVADFETQLKELEAVPNRIKKGEEHISNLNKTLKISQLDLNNKEETLNKAKQKLSVVNAKIKERNQQIAQINKLGKDAECPTCFQPLIKSYETTLQRFQKDIEAFTNKEKQEIQQNIDGQTKVCNETREGVEQQQQSIQEANKILASLLENQKEQEKLLGQQSKAQNNLKDYQDKIKTLGNISFDQNIYNNLKTEIESFRNTYISYRSQLDEVAKLPEEISAKAILLERIQKGKAGIAEKKTELKTLNFSEKAHQTTKENQTKLEQERDANQLLYNQHKEVVYNISTSIQSIESTLKAQEDIRNSIKDQQDDLETLETLEATFTKFKSKALNKVRPIISNHASLLFTQITKGRYESIEVDENFEFYIYDNGKRYPITRFSGGEVDLANLCLRIGISKAISELSGSSAAMNLLCFDEIFGSQDEERRFEILGALDLLKEQYRQIYIVSHIESIKDYFPNILQVQKDRDGSRVEWL
ncbi:MAG: exonuclease SbcC [Polaribacter sp.]|jgi:exonuclease SbcC